MYTRKERRTGAGKKKETFKERCERIAKSIEIGKKISDMNKTNNELAMMEAQADKNSEILQSFIDKFGEELGREMYNKNNELKSK